MSIKKIKNFFILLSFASLFIILKPFLKNGKILHQPTYKTNQSLLKLKGDKYKHLVYEDMFDNVISNYDKLNEININTTSKDASMELSTKGTNFEKIIADRETINICSLVTDSSYAKQFEVMVKSVLLFTSSNVHFYLFHGENTSYINEIVSTIESFTFAEISKFKLTLVKLNIRDEIQGIQNAAALKTRHNGVKVFFYFQLVEEMLKLDSAIFLDVDIVFLTDVKHFWNKLYEFNNSQVAAVAPAGGRYITGKSLYQNGRFPGPVGLNSGIMIFNLTKLRNSNFLNSLIGDINIAPSKRNGDDGGDQTFINSYFYDNPERLFQLNCEYNIHYSFNICAKTGHAKLLTDTCSSVLEVGILALHGASSLFIRETNSMHKIVFSKIEEFDPSQENPSLFAKRVLEELQLEHNPCKIVNIYTVFPNLNMSLHEMKVT